MKVLLGHNFYRSSAPSGEDSVFLMERELLRSAGHEAISYERRNDEIGESPLNRAAAAMDASWSRQTYREVRRLIQAHRPDVAHFHNTFPLISPSAYQACRDHDVPVVQTLHNYRLICAGALLMREGKPCESCVDGALLPGLRHGCYRGSIGATGIVTAMLALNRVKGSYTHNVDRYLALTEFARARFIRAGLPADRISVRPNFLNEAPKPGDGSGGFALYVGRLTPEKGIGTLLEAWRDIAYPLKIVGDGYLRAELEAQARSIGAPIEFLGFRSRQEVLRLMQLASILVIPSKCYEGFPITALEAFATGTPLVVSRLGALDEVVSENECGVKFEAGNASALATAVRLLLDAPERLAHMRSANRRLFEAQYTPQHALQSLEAIYTATIEGHRRPAANRPLSVTRRSATASS